MSLDLPEVPQLSDDSIVLRGLHDRDAEAIFRACHDDPVILRWTMRPLPFTRDSATEWIQERHEHRRAGKQLPFAIAHPDSNDLIGAIWLGRFDREAQRAEFGYWVTARERGKGVASRAVALVAEWALKERGLVRVQILAPLENPASQRVAEKAGFTKEGLLRSYRRIEGHHTDLIMYSLLRPDPT
ncbi:MAG: GNAT family N-acetyltransferase [Actinomycetota bacterium]